jgi:hypothetical protein
MPWEAKMRFDKAIHYKTLKMKHRIIVKKPGKDAKCISRRSQERKL